MLINVAIIEDDEKIRNNIKTLLNDSQNIKCVADYSDAESAILEISKVAPDVILVDINLPKMTGIEFVIKIKEILSTTLPIMLTVYDDFQNIYHSLQAGAFGYLLKTASPDEILNSIIEVYQGGSPMSAQIARKIVQSFHKEIKDKSSELTNRELEILQLLTKGYLYKEIAYHLNISSNTVHNHLRKIYEKLQVNNRTEAVVKHLLSLNE
ncbi:MAG: response regulator transcription factor [Ignavibacterium album]|jgi:DNA-binding NarL/FixJ family response regulator|uniref:response regulator n=1 Tax=Ignavibacterium album TaxID=591197 RepID=UPI0026F1C77B|nr:response regulator transcription factor [Ignavibacterium album]MBI5662329.1 response regulator transcription factor [Ignavibacterium album]